MCTSGQDTATDTLKQTTELPLSQGKGVTWPLQATDTVQLLGHVVVVVVVVVVVHTGPSVDQGDLTAGHSAKECPVISVSQKTSLRFRVWGLAQ